MKSETPETFMEYGFQPSLGTKGDVMVYTTKDSLADLEMKLTWEKQGITHSEIYFADEANFYRDYFPKGIGKQLLNKQAGDTLDFSFEPGELIPSYCEKDVHRVRHSQCNVRAVPGSPNMLRIGRYYPKGILRGLPNVFSENVTPFRVIDSDEQHVRSDFNHPLAGLPLSLSIGIHSVKPKNRERGGIASDWIEQTTSGPGIQARFDSKPTDYFSDDPFSREDRNRDSVFYEKERLVSHIDELARENLAQLYGKRLKKGSLVLDLMSSWQSHIPDNLELQGLIGLGMNESELRSNKRLTGHTVHDLNEHPAIPYPDGMFDSIICSLSVEYLTRPFDVFKEAARVLKPEGSFIVTFSNRWFPTKTIRLWPSLHEFERMGLVIEYFHDSGLFHRIETLSLRGYPRPYTDDYFPKLKLSDPLYLVQGLKKN